MWKTIPVGDSPRICHSILCVCPRCWAISCLEELGGGCWMLLCFVRFLFSFLFYFGKKKTKMLLICFFSRVDHTHCCISQWSWTWAEPCSSGEDADRNENDLSSATLTLLNTHNAFHVWCTSNIGAGPLSCLGLKLLCPGFLRSICLLTFPQQLDVRRLTNESNSCWAVPVRQQRWRRRWRLCRVTQGGEGFGRHVLADLFATFL